MFIFEIILNLGWFFTKIVVIFLGVVFFLGVAKGTIDSMISASKDTLILTFIIGTTFLTTMVFSYIQVFQSLGFFINEKVNVNTISIPESFNNPTNIDVLQKIETLKEEFRLELEKLSFENNLLKGDIEKLKETLVECNNNVFISNSNDTFLTSLYSSIIENDVCTTIGIVFITIIVGGLGYYYLSSNYHRLSYLVNNINHIDYPNVQNPTINNVAEKIVIDVMENETHFVLLDPIPDIILERVADDIFLDFLIENQQIIREVVILAMQQS